MSFAVDPKWPCRGENHSREEVLVELNLVQGVVAALAPIDDQHHQERDAGCDGIRPQCFACKRCQRSYHDSSNPNSVIHTGESLTAHFYYDMPRTTNQFCA